MFFKATRMVFQVILMLTIITLVILATARIITGVYAAGRTYSVNSAPPRRVAIVFGAGLWRDGSPTPILRDRVQAAAQLYFAGKVQKLLMSGDNRYLDYNEPGAMRGYALELGIPEADIVLDYAGRRTYDTCYRARQIFGVQQALLITQSFHLPRAIYTCNRLGLPAEGVPSDLRAYRQRSLLYWNLREVAATVVALWEVNISHPLPVLGNPEPIFPQE
jgi:SanA protein